MCSNVGGGRAVPVTATSQDAPRSSHPTSSSPRQRSSPRPPTTRSRPLPPSSTSSAYDPMRTSSPPLPSRCTTPRRRRGRHPGCRGRSSVPGLMRHHDLLDVEDRGAHGCVGCAWRTRKRSRAWSRTPRVRAPLRSTASDTWSRPSPPTRRWRPERPGRPRARRDPGRRRACRCRPPCARGPCRRRRAARRCRRWSRGSPSPGAAVEVVVGVLAARAVVLVGVPGVHQEVVAPAPLDPVPAAVADELVVALGAEEVVGVAGAEELDDRRRTRERAARRPRCRCPRRSRRRLTRSTTTPVADAE